MELLVFGHAGHRVIVFPTRQGRFFDYENWRLVEANRDRIAAGHIQLFCVDSVDSESLYCTDCPAPNRIARHCAYERYVLDEVIPFTLERNPHSALTVHGCSFGAYHSVNIALRHPQYFSRAVALSGRYDLTQQVGVFQDLFSGFYNEDVYFHTPTHFLPRLTDQVLLRQLRQIHFTLAVGEEDPFCQNTRDLCHILREKGIPHDLIVWQGEAHRAYYWRQMVRLYLEPAEDGRRGFRASTVF
jgi:esterase/lipase superfamily enzyme